MRYLYNRLLLWGGVALIAAGSVCAEPLVVDHTAVAAYTNIPQQYIEAVKEMWLGVPGESHSMAYRLGCELLESLDSRFQVNVTESGAPEGPTDQYLRVCSARRDGPWWRYGYGEADWFTNEEGRDRVKASLDYVHANGPPQAAIGFGWCWDMTWMNLPGGGIDPVYQVRWAGSSEGGPDGNMRWGLDAGDEALTGNRVCMQTYIDATEEYMAHCAASGYITKVFFTTGPVDSSGERGYQRYLKHEYIRDHVALNTDGILFDYADILCWSDAGELETTSWTDYGGTGQSFPFIHPDNMLDLDGTYAEDGDHIGERGALRLGKALWYMLARIAGWDGELPPDADGDGLPDVWEKAYFGSTAADVHGDEDSDGLNNWGEYVAGTDPTNAASVFVLDVQRSNNQIVIDFPALSAAPYGPGYSRYYSLETATNLLGPQWGAVPGYTDILGSDQDVSYTSSASPALFFQGRVRLEP